MHIYLSISGYANEAFLPTLISCVIARPRTPHLMVAAQYDSWQLSHLVHGYDGLEEKPKAYTAAEQRYAEVGRAGRMAGRWWKSLTPRGALKKNWHGRPINYFL